MTEPANTPTINDNTEETAVPQKFVGRDPVFDWITEQLQSGTTNMPLILVGKPGMGKTTLLNQIANGRLGEKIIPVYVDLAAWTGHGIGHLLNEVAQATLKKLNQIGVMFSPPDLSQFGEEPLQTFDQMVLAPTAGAIHGRTLLFLFDNLHILLRQIELGVLPDNAFTNLWQTIHQHQALHTLFALNDAASSLAPDALGFLQNFPNRELPVLTLSEITEQINQVFHYTIISDIVEYIYQLTGGHPSKMEELLAQLHQQQKHTPLQQLTVADIAAIARDLTGKIAPNTYALRPTRQQMRRIRQARRIKLRNRWWAGAALLGIILIATAVTLLTSGRNLALFAAENPTATPTNTSPAAAADAVAIVATTPTPTETAVPSPTATPTNTPRPTITPKPSATPTTTATPEIYPETRLRNPDNMTLVLVPAGTYFMGSEAPDFIAAPDEKPRHSVTISTFYIDKYEITVAQYAAFLTRLGDYRTACELIDCAQPRELAGFTTYLSEQDLGDGSRQYVALSGYADYPINHVSWFGAKAYCEAMGARLPTEAEWEYAARGTDGRIYPWGNQAPDPSRAVFNSDDYDNLKPVDALPDGASPFGAFGMAGSMWEWTADWYDESYYADSSRIDPTGPETGITRSIRGGAWPNAIEADRIRAANRSSLTPDFISASVGFRCAMDP